MAALRGFDVYSVTKAQTTPLVLGQAVVSRTLPAGYAVGGIDLTMPALDPNGTLFVTVGDPADTDRLMPGTTLGRDGGTIEWRTEPVTWHRYAKATTVSVYVSAAPTVTVVGGDVTMTLFAYPSVTLATAQAMVLEELGILKEDGTARAEELAQAVEAVTEVYDEFRGLKIGNRVDLEWPVELIPTWAVRHVAKNGARKLMGVFGVPMPRRQLLLAEANEALKDMRRQCAKGSILEPVRAVYY